MSCIKEIAEAFGVYKNKAIHYFMVVRDFYIENCGEIIHY